MGRLTWLVLILLLCVGCGGGGAVPAPPGNGNNGQQGLTLGRVTGGFYGAPIRDVLHNYAIGIRQAGSQVFDQLQWGETAVELYEVPGRYRFDSLPLGSYQLAVCYFNLDDDTPHVVWESEPIELSLSRFSVERDVVYNPFGDETEYLVLTHFRLSGTEPDLDEWDIVFGAQPIDGEPQFLYADSTRWDAIAQFVPSVFSGELYTNWTAVGMLPAGEYIVGVYGIRAATLRTSAAVTEYLVYGEFPASITATHLEDYDAEEFSQGSYPIVEVDFDNPVLRVVPDPT